MAGQNYGNLILTSIYGRRLGLQRATTAAFGITSAAELLVGPDAWREPNSTAETTSTRIEPWGISQLRGSSAASSSVFTLDTPIPGVRKTLFFGSTGDIGVYVKTANSETIQSTVGTSFTVVKSTVAGVLELIGVSTAIWGALNLTSGTSSNASGFALTTTT